MGILSIQSQVVAGHVGNSAAVFALQRLGAEIWPLPTILLSHHPGHGGAQGAAIPLATLQSLLAGLDARGCLENCAAVISGYLGQAAVAQIVRDALNRARTARDTIYLCDPVLGDDGRTYVNPDVVTAMRNLAAIADIITPNAYELFLLSGQRPATRAEAFGAMRLLQSQGPKIVITTSFCGADTPAGTLDILALDGAARFALSVPRLAEKFSGAGDVFAALFLHFWLPARDTAAALGAAGSALFAVLAETAARGGGELALLEAQHKLAAPDRHFLTERLA
jgi:pyridoxine kinase